jgi:hypothetical protein
MSGLNKVILLNSLDKAPNGRRLNSAVHWVLPDCPRARSARHRIHERRRPWREAEEAPGLSTDGPGRPSR